MRDYDNSQPLIFIHVPKCAGRSVSMIFRDWFGDGFLRHYYDEKAGIMPPRRDLAAIHHPERPVVVYGHFNRSRGFGVADYYPDARQFITILRDPFELALSTYFYTRKVGGSWKDQSRVPKQDLEAYLRTASLNMLQHFPREVTKENYRDIFEEFFIDVGVMEDLPQALARVAAKLRRKFSPEKLERLNVTPRETHVSESLRAVFRERHPLEFMVYEYALNRVSC